MLYYMSGEVQTRFFQKKENLIIKYDLDNLGKKGEIVYKETDGEDFVADENTYTVLRRTGHLTHSNGKTVDLTTKCRPQYWCALTKVGNHMIASGWHGTLYWNCFMLVNTKLEVVDWISIGNENWGSRFLPKTGLSHT